MHKWMWKFGFRPFLVKRNGFKVSPYIFSALGVHAFTMMDTPTVVAIVFGTIFFVLAGDDNFTNKINN
jgi:hypothetical protein